MASDVAYVLSAIERLLDMIKKVKVLETRMKFYMGILRDNRQIIQDNIKDDAALPDLTLKYLKEQLDQFESIIKKLEHAEEGTEKTKSGIQKIFKVFKNNVKTVLNATTYLEKLEKIKNNIKEASDVIIKRKQLEKSRKDEKEFEHIKKQNDEIKKLSKQIQEQNEEMKDIILKKRDEKDHQYSDEKYKADRRKDFAGLQRSISILEIEQKKHPEDELPEADKIFVKKVGKMLRLGAEVIDNVLRKRTTNPDVDAVLREVNTNEETRLLFQEQIHKLNDELLTEKDKTNDAQKEIINLLKENANFREILNQNSNMNNRDLEIIQSLLKDRNLENENLSNQNIRLQQQLDELDRKVQNNNRSFQLLQEQLDQKIAEANQLKLNQGHQQKRMAEKLRLLQNQLDIETNRNNDLKSNLSALKTKTETLQTENSSLRYKLKDKKANLSKMRTVIVVRGPRIVARGPFTNPLYEYTVQSNARAEINGTYMERVLPGYIGPPAFIHTRNPNFVLLRWHRNCWMLLDMGPGRDGFPGNGGIILYSVLSDSYTPVTGEWSSHEE